MARRKRRGGRKSKAIPVLPVLPIGFVVLNAYKSYGLTSQTMAKISKDMTGYDPAAKTFAAASAMPFWLGMVAGIVGHKVANKTVNKYIRKATMGYLVA